MKISFDYYSFENEKKILNLIYFLIGFLLFIIHHSYLVLSLISIYGK